MSTKLGWKSGEIWRQLAVQKLKSNHSTRKQQKIGTKNLNMKVKNQKNKEFKVLIFIT